MGTLDEKPVMFQLQINNEPPMEIPFVLQRGQWRSVNGVSVDYNVIEVATNVTRATINRDIELATVTGLKSRERQSSGILTITARPLWSPRRDH